MSALNFPDDPADVGNVYVGDNGVTYDYVNGKWRGRTASPLGAANLGKFVIVDDPGLAILSTTGTGYDIVIAATQGEGAQYISIPNNENAALGSNLIIGTSTSTSAVRIQSDTSAWTFGTDGVLTLPDANLVDYPAGVISFNFEGNNFNQLRNHNSTVFLESVEDAAPGYEVYGKGAILTQLAVSNNDVIIHTNMQGNIELGNIWTFGADGTTTFPDNTIKVTTSTNITVAGVAGITSSLAWYNIFGELNNSTSTNVTIDGSVVYDTEGNLFVLGSTYADGGDFPGVNLFLKYSPQGELLWRKTWSDDSGDACGSYNASLRFQPMAGTATIDTIVWASNGNSWSSDYFAGYIGTMDLEGNLVDLQGQPRAPLAIPDYRITDIVPSVTDIEGAVLSGSWYDREGTEYKYASIGAVDFNDTGFGVNYVFNPSDSYNYNDGGHFKSINVLGTGTAVWATGAYVSTEWGGNTTKTILGIVQAGQAEPQPSLYTIGANYSDYSMWTEDSGSDADGNIYGLINVWGYNNDTSIQYNNYTVLASNTPDGFLTINRWQKKITRVGADDGSFTTHGLGLVNHEGFVYVSLYLGVNSGNNSDFGLLKLDAATGAVVWARIIGSPYTESSWDSNGYGSSSDITVDPTGTYISFTASTNDPVGVSSPQANNFTIQYPLDGSLLGAFNQFGIYDSIDAFVVTDHDFNVVDITDSTTINVLSFTVTTATITATATTVGEGWTNFRWPLEAEVTGTSDQTWTFGADGGLTIPDDIQDANGSVIRVATTSTAPTRTDGQLWFNSEEGRTYIKYNGQWLDASPTQIPSPETYLDDIQIDGSTLSVGDYAWTFGGATDTFPGDIYDAEGPIVRFATTSTAPARANGQLWFNSEEGRTYIKYNGAWVDANPTQIPAPETYLDDIQVDGSEFLINGYSLTVDETGTLLVDGQQVTGSGGATDSITSGSYSVYVADTGVVTMATSRGNVEFGALPEPGGPSHFHIMKSSEDTGMDLFFGDDYNYVLQRGNSNAETAGHTNDYGVEIGAKDLSTGTSNQYVWRFETDGVLTLSTASTILGTGTDPNVYIETSTTSTTSTWTFGTNGILTLPAATPIIKGGGTGTDVTIIASTGLLYYSSQFDGTQYLEFLDAANLKLGDSTAFTIECWVYETEYYPAKNAVIIQKGGQKSVSYATYQLTLANDTIIFNTGTGGGGANTGGKTVSSDTPLPLDQWVHVAVVWDGTNINLYQNGVNVGTTAADPLEMGDNSGSVTIGTISGGNGNDNFVGKISNLRIVKNTPVYTGTFIPSATPLTSIANTSLLTCNSNTVVVNETIVNSSPWGLNSDRTWTFDADGGLSFPQGSTITETTATTVITPPGASAGQSLVIRPTAGGVDPETSHIHLVAGNPTTVDLYLGDDDQYVKIEKNGGNVDIGTNSSTNHWTFGADGTTLFPNAAIDGGTAPIELKSRSWSQLTYNNADMTPATNTNHSTTFYVEGGGAQLEIFRWDGDSVLQHRQWSFSNDGTLTLPDTGTITFSDATVQTTAYVAANVVNKTSGSWTLATGANTVSITVPPNRNYTMWVNGTCDNGIVTWNATVNVSNTNVPAIGSQYAWYYALGNALVLTAIPNQIVGTAGVISTSSSYVGSTANVFTFGITNNSTSSQVINWGYTTL
jgi:hypothetical protein